MLAIFNSAERQAAALRVALIGKKVDGFGDRRKCRHQPKAWKRG